MQNISLKTIQKIAKRVEDFAERLFTGRNGFFTRDVGDLEVTPIVAGGIMNVTAANAALHCRRVLWTN